MLNDERLGLAELEAAIKIAPPLPTKPGNNDNWVERFGVRKPTGGKGLPPYIDRIARHLFSENKARFPTVGAAVQTAVDKAKEWCATSTNPAVKAKACNAARQWMQMRARAGAARATKSMYPQAQKSIGHVDQFDLDFIELLGYETTPGFEVPVLTAAEERVLMDLAYVGEETLVPEAQEDEKEDSEIDEGSMRVGSSSLTDSSSGDTREGESPELAGPIVVKSAAKQVAYAPVLVPGEKDADGEVYDEDKIQEVAWDFIENHRYMDEQHRLSGQVAVPVESYILQNDMQVEMAGKTETVPKGSWMMGARFPDAEVWRRVETDELEGFSITAVRRADYEAAVEKAKAESNVATKSSHEDGMQVPTFRVKVSDLGDDWICPAVSVVRGPAVKKAKWIAKKSQAEGAEEDGTARNEAVGVLNYIARALGLTVEKSESESKEEELDVKITQAELDKKIEAAAEARIAALLAELEDDEDDLEEDDEDEDEVLSFESEEDFQAYVQEQAEAAIIAAAEEDDDEDGGAGDETSEELVAVKSELTEVKKALVKLGAMPKADKSQQIAGQGPGEGTKPFNMQEYLKRDAMGNYIGDKRAG